MLIYWNVINTKQTEGFAPLCQHCKALPCHSSHLCASISSLLEHSSCHVSSNWIYPHSVCSCKTKKTYTSNILISFSGFSCLSTRCSQVITNDYLGLVCFFMFNQVIGWFIRCQTTGKQCWSVFRQSQKVTSSNMFKKQKDFQFTVIVGGNKPEHIYSQEDRIRTCAFSKENYTNRLINGVIVAVKVIIDDQSSHRCSSTSFQIFK